MTLRVTTSKVEPDIVVLHLSGTTTIGPETDALELLVRDLLNRSSRLVFDLAGVDEIDADAALFFVRCFFAVKGAGVSSSSGPDTASPSQSQFRKRATPRKADRQSGVVRGG